MVRPELKAIQRGYDTLKPFKTAVGDFYVIISYGFRIQIEKYLILFGNIKEKLDNRYCAFILPLT